MLMLLLAGLLCGMAKTGVRGVNMISVPILAIIFGGKESTGLMLPILIFGDFFGGKHYHPHADWYHLRRLLPLAVIGVIVATFAGNYINDDAFLNVMAVIIFLSLSIMIWREKSKAQIPDSKWFVIVIGICGGFTTMLGNLGGSVLALYLLAMRLPKNVFIGTAAWFFLVINVVKVPFHVFVWKTITLQCFLLDTMIIPGIAIGAYLGVRITKKIPEKEYRIFIIGMTALAAVVMLI
jgi:uncharacterized protein